MIDPRLPETERAAAQIRAHVDQLRREQPDWTERQRLREARRRCAPAIRAAIEATELRRLALLAAAAGRAPTRTRETG